MYYTVQGRFFLTNTQYSYINSFSVNFHNYALTFTQLNSYDKFIVFNEMYDHLNFDSISNYFDLIQYNKALESSNHDSTLNLIHFNIRSLSSKLSQIEIILASLNKLPDIIIFTETWLNEENKDTIPLRGYNNFDIVRSTELS